MVALGRGSACERARRLGFVSDLITTRVSLDDVQKGIDAVLSGDAIKVVVLPSTN